MIRCASDLFLVDDCMSGFLEAYTNTDKINKAPYSKKLKLIFGLRLTFCPDMNNKSEEGRKDSYKNIIFVNNATRLQAVDKDLDYCRTRWVLL